MIVNKFHRGKILPKKIHVRIEHVKKSMCREAFKQRVRENDAKKIEAKKKGEKLNTKRIPHQPKPERLVKVADTKYEFINPLKFTELF